MKWPLVSRGRYDAELVAARSETERIRDERDSALKSANTWHGTASRTSELFTDTSIVNDCLTRDLLRSRRQRVIARKAAARILAAYAVEKRRADGLQTRLDGALGLYSAAVEDGRNWQARRTDKPTVAKEPTS